MAKYVLVIGPYDSCFIGPFDSVAKADAYCALTENEALSCYPMSEREMQLNMKEFGTIPIDAEPIAPRFIRMEDWDE